MAAPARDDWLLNNVLFNFCKCGAEVERIKERETFGGQETGKIIIKCPYCGEIDDPLKNKADDTGIVEYFNR